MALVLKNRVKEETTTTGTGAFALGGASAQFDTFQTYMSNGDTTYYSIAQSTAGTDEWEIGIGTWNTGNTLSRTTVLAGSNGTSAVDFSAGTKEIFMTYPADKAVFEDGSGNVSITGSVDAGAGLRLSTDGSNNAIITALGQDKDIYLSGDDGGSGVNALVLDMSNGGAATFSSTVNGRNLATDGTKLDGIESGATADQTASEILTSIKTVDGSGSGLDADTVDGIQGSSFLRSDADDSTSHNIEINGGSLRVGGTSYAMAMSTNGNQSTSSVGHTASNKEGIFWHTSNNYSIARTAGAWTAPTYQRLQIDWPTGIVISTEPLGTYTNSHTEFQSAIKSNIAQNEKIILSGSNDPYIRWQEGTTNKAYIQWNSSGFLEFRNQEDSSSIKLRDDIEFSPDGSTYYNIWHANNDGSGSGLDADTVDGIQGANFVRSDTGDTMSGSYTMTGALTLSQDGQDVINFSANDTNDNRGIAFNSRTALSADYNDGWLRLNNGSEFSNGVYTPGGLRVAGTLQVDGRIQHSGDSDTYIDFATNDIHMVAGNHTELYITTTGVRLGDTGNGYFQPVSGNYGSIQIDGGAHGGYEGYSIGGRVVFMHDNGSASGIYNDVNNEWMIYCQLNDYVGIYYNGAEKFRSTTYGLQVQAHNDIRLVNGNWTGETTCKIQHHSSNVYHQFNNSGQIIFRNSSGTNRFYFSSSGNFTASGNVTAYSDIRLKKDIVTIGSPIDKIKQMRGVYYKEIETDRERIGVIAQEVEPVLPEVVVDHEDVNPETGETSTTKTVDYGNMVGLLIEAIKEQQKQIDELKDRLA